MSFGDGKFMSNFIEIPLTLGKTALIDSEDFELISRFKWQAFSNGNKNNPVIYAVRGKRICGKMKTIFMHRFIMNALTGLEVDHINHNTLDNRKYNLRIVTRAENLRNRQIQINNSTGYKGVYKNSKTGKFYSQISLQGKNKHLGYFDAAETAAYAYDRAAIRYYGEFACLNFPNRQETIGRFIECR